MNISETLQSLFNITTYPSFENIALSCVGLIVALIAVLAVQWLSLFLQARAEMMRGKWIRGLTLRGYTIWNEQQLTQFLLGVIRFFGKVLIFLCFTSWIIWAASLFSSLESVLKELTDFIETSTLQVLRAIWSYLPRLVFVVFIGFITLWILRGIRFIFGEIEKEKIKFDGFYVEWSRPTSRIIQGIVIMFMAALIIPNLPGSQSDAFKGISIFVGILVSLGSTSAVRNAVAGIVLTYMRSYKTSDFVNIANTLGTIVEKGVLVTKVLTPRLEEVSIPNAEVLNNHVINYSAQARKKGVIFHTTMTVIYDVPWTKIHTLLLKAAEETQNVAHDPKPFVLHSKLHDFYVEYELNVYVTAPDQWIHIYSELNKNIQRIAKDMNVDLNTPTHLHVRGPLPEVTITEKNH